MLRTAIINAVRSGYKVEFVGAEDKSLPGVNDYCLRVSDVSVVHLENLPFNCTEDHLARLINLRVLMLNQRKWPSLLSPNAEQAG